MSAREAKNTCALFSLRAISRADKWQKNVNMEVRFTSQYNAGPMAQLLVLYNTPADPAAFDHYYHHTHIGLAKKIPGLRSYVISNGPVQAPTGTAPHLVAILEFDSLTDLNAAVESPEGRAAAADLSNFASGGATLLIYDSKAV
jgi:uncharacterized protein (TIGR02118 family)